MMSSASVALLAALAGLGACRERAPLVALGGDPARGVLVNLGLGPAPGGWPDPSRPTVVFVHGFNPAPRTVHFRMADELAGALGRRFGPAFNVLAWDWNAATFERLEPRANHEAAVHQGRLLAVALRASGMVPERTHLIGHSHGAIVAASAARAILAGSGRALAQLTLLEPASYYHDVVFDRLAAGTLARRVENYWAPGPSGYGRPADRPGVIDVRVAGPTPYLGVVCPLRSSHLAVVRWYFATAADPSRPAGFNASLLLAPGG